MQNDSDHPIKVLVPVPLSGNFKTPLKQAYSFYRQYGAEITLLSVFHNISRLEKWVTRRKIKLHSERAIKKKKKKINRYFHDEAFINHIRFDVKTGDFVSSILKVAKEMEADLIILKKTKRASTQRRFLKQENVDKLIANSVHPVLTVDKKPAQNGISKILLPVDITKKTDNKIAWAISMAKRFDAEVRIFSVMNMKIKPVHSLSYKKGKQIEEQIRNEGIKTELVIVDRGDMNVEDQVLDYADEYRPDLILIMTHQENILFDNYLGKFAREIIHESKVPVFSVIPQKETVFSVFFDSVVEMSGSHRKAKKDKSEE